MLGVEYGISIVQSAEYQPERSIISSYVSFVPELTVVRDVHPSNIPFTPHLFLVILYDERLI